MNVFDIQGIHFFFFFKIHLLFESESTGGEGDVDSPRSREPDVGLPPSTLGSRPELKADA